jgi:hypothetical protein
METEELQELQELPKPPKVVTIIPSVTISECRLEELIGRQGEVLEARYTDTGAVKGYWLSLIGEPFLGEQEWYIPYNSIIE